MILYTFAIETKMKGMDSSMNRIRFDYKPDIQ